MPVTRSDSVLSRPLSIASISAFLRTAFAAAGITTTPVEFDRNGRRIIVWEHIGDPARTFGRFFYAVSFTASNIRQTVCATFDTVANNFPAGVQWSSDYFFQSSGQIFAIALRSSEASLVMLRNEFDAGTERLGWFRPSFRASFWDEGAVPYVFCEDSGGNRVFSTERMYETNGDLRQSWVDSFPAGRNAINNQVDILTGLFLYSQGGGVMGVLGADWARATDSGSLIPGSIIATPSGQQYMIFVPGLGSTGAAVVRTI